MTINSDQNTLVRGELKKALERSLPVQELAEEKEDSAPRLLAYRIVGTSHLVMGNLTDAHRHLEAAERIYEPSKHSGLVNRFGYPAIPERISIQYYFRNSALGTSFSNNVRLATVANKSQRRSTSDAR